MARLGIGLALLASLGFLAWFVIAKLNSPGLSIGAAVIGIPLLLCLFALFKTQANGVSKDAKGAGWAAAAIALLATAYFAVISPAWSIVALLWFGMHIPMVIALKTSPTVE